MRESFFCQKNVRGPVVNRDIMAMLGRMKRGGVVIAH